MALVDKAISKQSFMQQLATRFRSVFLTLGLPVIGLVILSVLAVIIRDLFQR